MPADLPGKRSAKPSSEPAGKRPPRPPRQAAGRKRPAKPSGSASDDENPRDVRLQRALAAAGFGSRRQCEELITEGRVEVDGQTVDKLGTTVDPSHAKIYVDGTPLKPHRLVYFMVNKPIGVVTTNSDPQGRPRVIDLVPPEERVFPVGRLDRASEGLILLTNDGDLAQRLAHPRFEVPKVYRVTVAGNVTAEALREMRHGIYISEGLVRVEGAKVLKAKSKSTEMEITLKEGKNREIRRILARLGHKVQTLKRIAMGSLRMGELPTGAYRKLSVEELKKLKRTGETEPGAETPEGTTSAKPRAGKSAGKPSGKPVRERKPADDTRPRPTGRTDDARPRPTSRADDGRPQPTGRTDDTRPRTTSRADVGRPQPTGRTNDTRPRTTSRADVGRPQPTGRTAETRPRTTSRADGKPTARPRALPVENSDESFGGKRESYQPPPSFLPTGNRGGVVIGGDEPERRSKSNRGKSRPADENTLVISPRRKGKQLPPPPADEATPQPQSPPASRPAKGAKRGKPVARAARREDSADDAPPRAERPAVPGKRVGGTKRGAPGKRVASSDRSNADRPAPGKRSTAAKRSAPGKRPATGKRSAPGKRSAAGSRPDFGKRPAPGKRPGGGRNRKRPGGDDNE